MTGPSDIVILGLSITSSWGNGHATTYRSLVRGLSARGHRVLFLERDMPWYAGNRDEPNPAGARVELYQSVDDLSARFESEVSRAALVVVGSFVPEGTRAAEWVLATVRGVAAFYDIDTPVTLAKLAEGDCEYLSPAQVPAYHIYFSFTGGPTLRAIERRWGSPMARALYCSVDPEQYRPARRVDRWDLGYLGTYSVDRQPALEELLLAPARNWPEGRFSVAGPMYPEEIRWPENVDREIHLAPREHPAFYGSQRFTLNITRAAMKAAGFSPSVRLFEAGACGAPVISDWWDGLDSILEPGKEVLVASTSEDTLRYLREFPEEKRLALGDAARRRMLAEHTPAQRAAQLESCWKEAYDHVLADPPRRHRRHRKSDGRVDAGMAPDGGRKAAGAETGQPPERPVDPGRLHEPAGAGH